MPTQKEILIVLATKNTAVEREEIGRILGESYRKFQTPLDRMESRGLVTQENHEYTITNKGRLSIGVMKENESTESGRFSFYITEIDISRLDESSFAQTWECLGKIVKNRSREVSADTKE